MPDESVSFLTSLFVHVFLVLILALISTSFNAGLRPLLLLNANDVFSVEALDVATFEAASVNSDQEQDDTGRQTVNTLDMAVTEPSLPLAEIVSPTSTADSLPKTWVPSELISTVGSSNPQQPIANASRRGLQGDQLPYARDQDQRA